MTSELLPCPFCGGEADFLEGEIYESRDRVECSACPATVEGADPAKAITAWNTRAKADQIMGVEGEELQDQLIAAYMAGCQAVHDNYQPDPDPDFTEAAWDYALSVLKAPSHDQ